MLFPAQMIMLLHKVSTCVACDRQCTIGDLKVAKMCGPPSFWVRACRANEWTLRALPAHAVESER